MNCKYCSGLCKKSGRQLTGKQKYQCIDCKKYQQSLYVYHACTKEINASIIKHVKRGNGIRDIAYLLNISNTTVIKSIRQIASSLESTYASGKGCVYEMDELRTFLALVGNHVSRRGSAFSANHPVLCNVKYYKL